MKGKLSSELKITGRITPAGQKIKGTLTPEGQTITGRVTTYGVPNPYLGPYDVTPKVEPQLLLTEGKTMREDLTVWGIPYTEVSNPNGTTCIIG